MTPEQFRTACDSLKRSNRRLAVVGRFSFEQLPRIYHFTNDLTAKPDGRLSAADLFRMLGPHLRSTRVHTMEIGSYRFQTFGLETPAAAGAAGEELPIPIDSPLFEESASWAYDSDTDNDGIIQKKGGELFRRLLEDLDVVTRYSHPNFGRSLLALARAYLGPAVIRATSNQFPLETKLRSLIAERPELEASIVRFLTCYGSDNEIAIETFRRALNDAKTFSGQQVNSLAQALRNLKQALSSGPLEADPDLKNLAKEALPWLHDYPGADENHRMTGAMIWEERDGQGQWVNAAGQREFSAYYRCFRRASDNVHRFVRSAPLHSYLFCWLAGKYKAHNRNTRDAAAQVMFDVGIRGQKDRIPGESWEDRERNRQIIRDEPALAGTEDAFIGDENYKRFRQLNQANIIQALEPDSTFTRDVLRNWLTDLFATLAQLCGGEAGKILGELKSYNGSFVKIYHTIVLAQPKSSGTLAMADLSEALVNLYPDKTTAADEPGAAFVDNFLAPLKETTATGEDLRRQAKESFVRAFASTSKTRFAQRWDSLKDKIKEQEDTYKDLYRQVRLGVRVNPATSDVGLPAVTVVPVTLQPAAEKIRSTREANLAGLIKQSIGSAMPQSVVVTRPDVLPPTPSVTLEGRYDGKPVVEAEPIVDQVALLPPDDTKPDYAELTSPDVVVVEEAGGEPLQLDGKPATLKALFPFLEDFDKPEPPRWVVGPRPSGFPEHPKLLAVLRGAGQTDKTLLTISPAYSQMRLRPVQGAPPEQAASKTTVLVAKQDASHSVAPDSPAETSAAPPPAAEPFLIDGKPVTVQQLFREVSGFVPRSPLGFEPEELAKKEQLLADLQKNFVETYLETDGDDAVGGLRRQLRALLLGEYVLAAPAKATYLGVPDLGSLLGVIMDMVQHIGRHGADSGPFDNKPTDETTRNLPAINLSKYFPVSDAKAAEEMGGILQHQYTKCEKLGNVRAYMATLREVRSLIEALASTKAELLIVNDTLAGQTSLEGDAGFFPASEKPLVAYLTDQAFKDLASAPAEVAVLARRIAEAIPRADVQAPLVVSGLTVSADDTPLPVVDPQTTPLPTLTPAALGLNRDATGIAVEELTIANPHLLLAAALVGPDARAGRIPPSPSKEDLRLAGQALQDRSVKLSRVAWDIPGRATTDWSQKVGGQLKSNSSLTELFATAWRPASNSALVKNLAMVKLINLMIWNRRAEGGPALSTNIVPHLKFALANPDLVTAAFESLGWPASDYAVALHLVGAWQQHGIITGAHNLSVEFRFEHTTEPRFTLVLDGIKWKNAFQETLASAGA
jgi:hypothetical protein